ncbi:MAG: hypothetical protein SPE21_08905 [Candidatus Cryptobacteroides sp.]|nr:hypothetical protein [Candidatus Cryptobacteroides sp.]
MKKITYTLAAIFASAFALTSCTKEMTDSSKDIESQGIPFEICASVSQTRTTTDNSWNTTWVAKDAINLFHAKAGTTTYESDGQFTVADTESGKFKGTLAGTLDADSYDWYAFYPYKSQISSPGQQTDGYTFIGHSGAATQNGNNDRQHLGTTLCPLYGISKGLKASAPVAIEMQQLTSVVEIVVKNTTTEPLTVTSIAFSTDEDIVGSYYINFAGENVVYTPKDGYTKTVANLTVNDGTALNQNETASFFIPIKPHVANSGSTITLTVNGYEKTKELTSDVTFAAGKIKTLNFNYNIIPSDDVYTLVETDGAFENDGKYVLAIKDGKTGEYYFISNAGTSKTLVKSALTVADGKITNPDAKYVFTAETAEGGYKLINSTNKYIYTSGSNTTLNTNSSSSSTWVSTFLYSSKTYKLQVSSTNGRYMGAKSSSEVGAYANTNYVNQIADKKNVAQFAGAISVFKLGYDFTTEPVILADNISNVSARGESAGVLNYTIQNPVEETSIFATCDSVVVTQVVEQEGSFLYKVAPNQTTSARKGSITLTYGAVTKIVTVSQLAPVFTVSRTEVELEAKAESSTTITITSDFDWYSEASSAAGFISTPTTCEWTTEPPYTDGKTTVTIKANAANDSKEGTKELGTLTFTNLITEETLAVTVKQKSSYTPPITSNIKTFNVSDFSGGTSSTGSEVKTTMTPITVATDKGYVDPNTAVRVYKNGYITISSTLGVITKIELTSTASNGSDYGPAKLSLPSEQPGSSSYSSNVTTWKGSASEVKFKATAQYRFTKIVVTYN